MDGVTPGGGTRGTSGGSGAVGSCVISMPAFAPASAAFVLTNCCNSPGVIRLGSFFDRLDVDSLFAPHPADKPAHSVAAVSRSAGISRKRVMAILRFPFHCSLNYARNLRGSLGGGGVHALASGTAKAAMRSGTIP